MSLFYSATGGFYDDEMDLPADAVAITDDYHKELLAAQSNGAVITHDESGYPVSVVPPVVNPTEEDLMVDATCKINTLLSSIALKITPLQDAVDLGIATEDETTALAAWKNYRVLVNRVPTQSGYPTTIDWPPMPE